MLVRTRPWNTAWGLITSATITTDHNGISAVTDITGLSVTWNAMAGRKYKLTAYMLVIQNTSAGFVDIRLADSSNVVVGQSTFNQAASAYATHSPIAILSGLSGSVTYKARAATTAGTINIDVSSTFPGLLLVEDIGPA
jgi:hypothetical protein